MRLIAAPTAGTPVLSAASRYARAVKIMNPPLKKKQSS